VIFETKKVEGILKTTTPLKIDANETRQTTEIVNEGFCE
jgi:hypothetical protein